MFLRTGLDLLKPELPCDPVTSPEILSGTHSARLETPTEDLDGCLESEETSDSLLLNSPVPQRYPQLILNSRDVQ